MNGLSLIGGMPSSGSTLLVDLLSNRPGVLCLPETGLFAHGRNVVDLSASAAKHDLTWNLPWLDTGTKVAQSLGWSASMLDSAAERFSTTLALLDDAIDRTPGTLVIEKTPENAFALGRYLDGDPGRRAVVTTRDAPSVIQSLMRRGFGLSEAAVMWFAYAYYIARLLESNPRRVFHCRYSELTTSPEQTVDAISRFLRKQASKNGERAPKNGAVGSAERSGSEDSIRNMLSISQWELTDTAWTRSPRQPPTPVPAINLVGLRLELILARSVFVTPDHGPVRSADLEAGLGENRVSIKTFKGPTHALLPMMSTPIGACLLEHFRARCVEGAL